MVSVVVVGAEMSGKTTLCHRLLGFKEPRQHLKTQSCYYLSAFVNNQEWHVWDTPALASRSDIEAGWSGESVLREANVVVVCHDGRYNYNPMELVEACGKNRAVIALTNGQNAAFDLSYMLPYLQTSCCYSTMLVPRASDLNMLIFMIAAIGSRCC